MLEKKLETKNTMNRNPFLVILISLLLISINLAVVPISVASTEPIPGHLNVTFQIQKEDLSVADTAFKTIESIKSPQDIQDMLQQIDEELILEYLEPLVAFGPRVTDSQACYDAEQYIYSEFEAMEGIEVQFEAWENQGHFGRNVEATLTGLQDEDILIICGHMDSVTGSPGADDNGIGTVAAMIAADVMSDYTFNHTIRFVTFSGEEQGLLGSEIYATNCSQRGDDIAAVLNADMIGNADTEEGKTLIKIFSNEDSHWLVDFTESVSEAYNIGIGVVDRGYSWGSDHSSFWDQGYDAVFFHENDFSEVYHSPQDTIENMDISYAVNTTRLMIATLAELAEPNLVSTPPDEPTIEIITTPVYNQPTEIQIQTIDDDNDNVSFYIDWGDGQSTDWTEEISSGQSLSISHIWTRPGQYEIRAKARDNNSVIGPWASKDIFVDGPILEIGQLNGGLLGLTIPITNTGGYSFTEATVDLSVQGGFILYGGSQQHILEGLDSLEQTTIKATLLGFGQIRINVVASIQGIYETSTSQDANLYLFFLKM